MRIDLSAEVATIAVTVIYEYFYPSLRELGELLTGSCLLRIPYFSRRQQFVEKVSDWLYIFGNPAIVLILNEVMTRKQPRGYPRQNASTDTRRPCNAQTKDSAKVPNSVHPVLIHHTSIRKGFKVQQPKKDNVGHRLCKLPKMRSGQMMSRKSVALTVMHTASLIQEES